MNIFFQRQQNLAWIHRFGQVIGYFIADGHIHDVLFFAFGNHHHRYIWVQDFNLSQGFEATQAGHIFIQKDDIKTFILAYLNGVFSVGDGHHFISFFFQKEQVGFQ